MSRLQDEVELEISVRRLREKFHGKISIEKAALLMRRYGNDHRRIAMEIVLMKDRDLDDEDRHDLSNDITVKNVVEKLKAEEENPHSASQSHIPTGQASSQKRPPKSGKKPKANKQPTEDKDIQELLQRLRVLPLTQKNLRMFDNAQRDVIPSDVHQFACGQCDSDWWRRVAQRKRVSRCFKCKRKYDPVPADKMWGIGDFNCPNCTRTFKGFGRMDLGSPCYGCRSLITPIAILPPRRNMVMGPGPGPRSKNQHSCFAEDCFNRQEPHVRGTECVHPRSRQKNRKPRVVNPSPAHISSGSTVNTCLSQGSILDLYEHVREDVIYEEEEDDDEDDDNDDDVETDSSAGSDR
ncbi:shiftless antiviral inhibitor of ribosomal frameshifting protein homolog [Engraulis encrasicolus]|uniref:shiftless antiviral inhibitor of ribosomal frameshifting protein homolog n=1 Tax=Engraulis encrasicolus TaxID=184585 RepID=UPI002FD5B4D7